MANPIDILNQGATVANANGTQSTTGYMPDWYMDYTRGLANAGLAAASTPYQAYPGQRVADFNNAQQTAFQSVAQNQGAWQPLAQGAQQAAGNVPGLAVNQGTAANNFGRDATGAVAGGSQNWLGYADAYMSPYTKNVVNEIGRLGQQQMQEGLSSNVMDAFVGSGQFGSTRNAEMLGRYLRDSNNNILGQQSNALQQGYTNSANIFNNDANRWQQQQGLQAQTALGAGQLANATGSMIGTAGTQAAGALGTLSQQYQNQLGTDATALLGVGNQMQGLEQQGLDTNYQNFQNQLNWNWNQLGNASNLVRGYQMPTSSSTMTSTPIPGSQGSTVTGALGQIFGVGQTGGN